MNDRYLYKAKRTDNGEWVEGQLLESNFSTFIVTMVNIYMSKQGIKERMSNIW